MLPVAFQLLLSDATCCLLTLPVAFQVCCVQDTHMLAVWSQDLPGDQQLLGCKPPLLDQRHSLLWADSSSGKIKIESMVR